MNELERQKLDALKELAYGASHEINNPLANIAARAQTLLRDEVHPERRRALEAIHQQALRAHEMISDLMLFARPPRLVLGDVELGGLTEQVVRSLKSETIARQIELTASLPARAIVIQGDTDQLTVAITALLRNAIEAIGRGGQILVSLRQQEIADRTRAVIEVVDTGPGIPPEIYEHIFEPFFSGREAGRGLGFGLSKCWRIVTEHGGEIVISPQAREGTTFTVYLPMTT